MQPGRRAIWRAALACLAGCWLATLLYAPVYALTAANTDDEIVYLDPGGAIRVVDPRPSSTQLTVQWASPEGGWTALALGDFNADGDLEIAALRPEGDGGRLAIFDPVVIDVPAGHDKYMAGVAWDLLYSLSLAERPGALVSGNFDPARPGAELLYSEVPPEEQIREGAPIRVTVVRGTGAAPDGRNWETMASYASAFNWTWAASGNADGDGADEVALIDRTAGNLALLRVTNTLAPFFSNRNVGLAWQQAALGQFVAGGPTELVAIRDAALPANSFWVFRYENNTMVDLRGEAFLPSPTALFLADLGGTGSEAAMMLRSVRQEVRGRPRLIIRDNANSTTGMRDALLDGDNGYQGGAGGDIDGDGRDEIVLVRDSRIRIYTEPEKSARFEEILTPTDARTVRAGNLDANGLAGQSRLGASLERVAATLRVGDDNDSVSLQVSDITNAEGLAVNVRVERESQWVSVTPSSGQTPLTLTVTLDSSGLNPGVYQNRILVDAERSGVADDPLAIPVVLTVESGVTIQPKQLAFVTYPCDAAPAVQSEVLRLTSSDKLAVSYTATVEGGPGWITVTPNSGDLPDDDQLTVRVAADRPRESLTVNLVLTLTLPGVPEVKQRVPVALVCASARLFLPSVMTGTP
ncbi:MAG: hypothetical protein IT329_17655 [Caldilineaceae bacterium]|nr:hypothetical protein [Caldilineaceae bacterium]